MKISKSSIEAGLKKFSSDVKTDVHRVEADFKHGGGWGSTAMNVARDTRDSFFAAGAEVVGVAETLGLRYGVKTYSAKVDDGLTRGSRIENQQDYQNLKQQGFKSIVDLTLEGTNDAKMAPAAGLNTLNVKILDNAAPTEAQMTQMLDFVTAPQNSPAYIHCEAGKGRTGVATACYRMAVDGWSPDRAIAEARQYGLALPNQIDFLKQFGTDLAAGRIAGYPKA